MHSTFRQIKLDKKSSEKNVMLINITCILLFLAATLWGVSSFKVNPILATVCLILFAFVVNKYIRTFQPDWARKKDEIGILEFHNSFFVSDAFGFRQTFEYINIKSIKLHHNYVKGENYSNRDISHNGIATLEVLFKDGDIKRFKFLIKEKKQLQNFLPIWKKIYKSGITVKENMFDHEIKTILFKIDLSYTYEEFQILKKELGITAFY